MKLILILLFLFGIGCGSINKEFVRQIDDSDKLIIPEYVRCLDDPVCIRYMVGCVDDTTCNDCKEARMIMILTRQQMIEEARK